MCVCVWHQNVTSSTARLTTEFEGGEALFFSLKSVELHTTRTILSQCFNGFDAEWVSYMVYNNKLQQNVQIDCHRKMLVNTSAGAQKYSSNNNNNNNRSGNFFLFLFVTRGGVYGEIGIRENELRYFFIIIIPTSSINDI